MAFGNLKTIVVEVMAIRRAAYRNNVTHYLDIVECSDSACNLDIFLKNVFKF